MMDEKVLSVKPISLVKVKELLKELAKEGELTYEQSLTLKYADKFSKISRPKADKLVAELMEIEGMTDEIAIKITDLLPQNTEVISLIIGKNTKVSDESLDKILKLVKGVYSGESKEKVSTGKKPKTKEKK